MSVLSAATVFKLSTPPALVLSAATVFKLPTPPALRLQENYIHYMQLVTNSITKIDDHSSRHLATTKHHDLLVIVADDSCVKQCRRAEDHHQKIHHLQHITVLSVTVQTMESCGAIEDMVEFKFHCCQQVKGNAAEFSKWLYAVHNNSPWKPCCSTVWETRCVRKSGIQLSARRRPDRAYKGRLALSSWSDEASIVVVTLAGRCESRGVLIVLLGRHSRCQRRRSRRPDDADVDAGCVVLLACYSTSSSSLALHAALPRNETPGGVAPGFSRVGIVADDAAGRRVFSGIFRFPGPLIPALLHPHLASPSSQNLDGPIPAFTWSDFAKPWKTEIRMAGPGIVPTAPPRSLHLSTMAADLGSRFRTVSFGGSKMNFISISSPALNSNGATVFCVDLGSDLGSIFKPRWCNR
ncbi:hypothetical protein PR048_008353 [Dryococelus australis]|uniref:Uncharacterized protein n=1 Tax=Dryococelus australis TaxID=614101 RepID=A0ABQ9HWV1_9NEOP|nr:hypothetical protein PR048_008353 [Dryococelus australis]